MRFVAIDVETANPNMGSICQIGLVRFEDGRETACETMLVDPQTWFDPMNVSIHGITEDDVVGAGTFTELHGWLCDWTAGETVVCHTHFDRVAIARACAASSVPAPTCGWLDSARVTRRAWPQFARGGYGLANVADFLGITFQHHDAQHDARAAGLILIEAIKATGHDLDQWLHRVTRPITPQGPISRTGDGDGALVGEAVVFTGALLVPRREAADMAAAAGGDVHPGVTKRTTLLVVGDQDIAKLNGHEKSSKHIKAERLVASGQSIRIIGETDFMELVAVTS